MNLLVWGIGNTARKALDENEALLLRNNINIVAYVDSYIKDDHTLFRGIQVIAPKDIKKQVYDKLVILSIYYDMIKEQAINLGVEEKKIISENELIQISLFSQPSDEWLRILNTNESLPVKKRLLLSLIKTPYLQVKVRDFLDYSYIKEKYDKEILENVYVPAKGEESNILWVCWLQGIENAPEIVKCCIESMKYKILSRKIVIITEKNYKDYVDIPCDIEKYYFDGIMSPAQFSDILRLNLLAYLGGGYI